METFFITTVDELHARVVCGVTVESEFLEFKEKIEYRKQSDPGTEHGRQRKDAREIAREFARDIVAFANTWGGCILVGVQEGSAIQGSYHVAGSICGVPDPPTGSGTIEHLEKPEQFSAIVPMLAGSSRQPSPR